MQRMLGMHRRGRLDLVKMLCRSKTRTQSSLKKSFFPPALNDADAVIEVEKMVRFDENAEESSYGYTAYLQCALGRVHELRLNTFVSRARWSRAFDSGVNGQEACRRAQALIVEMEEMDHSDEDAFILQKEQPPWVVIDEGDDRQRVAKECFGILDGGRLSEGFRSRRLHAQAQEEDGVQMDFVPSAPPAGSSAIAAHFSRPERYFGSVLRVERGQ
eukprot:TRINITY_DN16968_c0_g1_i1.p1 TRINITY_DN16968_c0_g1~~TRINITY_DN16968_c0_g1_i1.p1  ORF type:complete len:216 (+),score=55.35 TRINITY_DN16968_c0_g1_i1:229-876(+)